MRRALVAIGGAAALLLGLWLESSPAPPPSDAPGFLLIVAGVCAIALSIAWRTRAMVWLLGVWAALIVADLVLAYWSNGPEEWAAMATRAGAIELVAHLALAPLEVALGLLVGYRDALGPVVVSACLAAGLLGSALVRRQWPRRWNQAASA